jgi:hypothetical protein
MIEFAVFCGASAIAAGFVAAIAGLVGERICGAVAAALAWVRA